MRNILCTFILAQFFSLSANTNSLAGIEKLHAPKTRMTEWNDWKFGMFIHWGPWSQTDIGYIWHITQEQTPEERVKSFDLYKTFNPVKFDPRVWAKIAKDAGMRYVVFTTKHHDGFCNYDTEFTNL